MSVFSKIRGTIETLFQVGLGGPQLKNNAGSIDARNPTDTGYVNVRGLDPVIASDLATKNYVDSGGASGQVREIRIPITTAAAQTSVTSLPAGAIVSSAELNIQVAYSVGATISLGQAGAPTAFMLTTDNNPQVPNLYQDMQDTAAPSVNPLLVTVGGAPAAGSGFAIVRFAVPDN